MIQLYGPFSPRITFNSPEAVDGVKKQAGFDVSQCKTIGQALDLYKQEHGVSLIAYDGRYENVPFDPNEPKYFTCSFERRALGREGMLVDLHVERNGEALCVKQRLDFDLLDGDIISLGPTVC